MAVKPNIDRLYDAVREFQDECRRATKAGDPGSWGRSFEEARARFRVKAEQMGIADIFDWTDENA